MQITFILPLIKLQVQSDVITRFYIDTSTLHHYTSTNRTIIDVFILKIIYNSTTQKKTNTTVFVTRENTIILPLGSKM